MIEELLAYQAVDAGLREIEQKLGANEDRKKAAVAKRYIDGVEESVNKLDARAGELMAAYDQAVCEQKKLKEQEDEFVKATKSAADENEANYLVKKIDELLGQIRNITAKISQLSDEISSIMKEYSNIKNQTKAAQAQLVESGTKYNEYKATFAEEKEKIEKELEKLKKKVDPDLMERYLKKRTAKIYPIVYEVTGEVCGACNMQLSMSDINRLKNGEVIECDQCGRLLYKK